MLLEKSDSVPATRITFKRFQPSSHDEIACQQHLGGCPVKALEAALARESKLLREKDALIIEQELLHSESDHRLMNGLQLVVSLLSLQTRALRRCHSDAPRSRNRHAPLFGRISAGRIF